MMVETPLPWPARKKSFFLSHVTWNMPIKEVRTLHEMGTIIRWSMSITTWLQWQYATRMIPTTRHTNQWNICTCSASLLLLAQLLSQGTYHVQSNGHNRADMRMLLYGSASIAALHLCCIMSNHALSSFKTWDRLFWFTVIINRHWEWTTPFPLACLFTSYYRFISIR